jgi:benzoyl-CoA reductase subunit A
MSENGAMRVFVGIDLGSTTTKAIVLDEAGKVLGRGITNSRSDYDVACNVAREEAFIQTRLTLVRDALSSDAGVRERGAEFLPTLERSFRLQQHLAQLERLREAIHRETAVPRHFAHRKELGGVVDRIVDGMVKRAPRLYAPGAARKSDFFRDLAGAEYMELAAEMSDPLGITFEMLCGVYDAAILGVENTTTDSFFERHIGDALESALDEAGPSLHDAREALRGAVETARSVGLDEAATVGTGYGRQRLPFPKEQIRSEILCHGLGAHAMFEKTATVLDIGGQDTKAIQVDRDGIVTSFQMNDRCAAGCGRYLGYIADEMNLGLHELGPLAQQATSQVKISSTCTVFAGAELRDRLSMGQRREDILAGLHRSIMLRAMSLLARSGGVETEFTFTGGVAKNPAAVDALRELVQENYGISEMNISPDSIYTGALGAALFAIRGEPAEDAA